MGPAETSSVTCKLANWLIYSVWQSHFAVTCQCSISTLWDKWLIFCIVSSALSMLMSDVLILVRSSSPVHGLSSHVTCGVTSSPSDSSSPDVTWPWPAHHPCSPVTRWDRYTNTALGILGSTYYVIQERFSVRSTSVQCNVPDAFTYNAMPYWALSRCELMMFNVVMYNHTVLLTVESSLE